MIHKHVNVASVVSAQRNVVQRAAASKHNFIPPLWGRYSIYIEKETIRCQNFIDKTKRELTLVTF